MTPSPRALAAPLRLPSDRGTSSPEGGRDWARLQAHHEVERELAQRLKSADPAARKRLYSEAYDELYRRVPDHPQLVHKQDAADRRRYVADQMRLLGRFLGADARFIEIGPGDCALSLHVCPLVREVHAVDVSAEITRRSDLPPNFALHLSDGVSVPHPDGGVDVVYSNQLMEHLHPDDARDQLRNIVAALAPGGVYVCVTPNRLMGPHDISRYFSDEAQGLHLKEYTATELLALFQLAGLRHTQVLVAIRNRYLRLPHWLVRAAETTMGHASAAVRRRMAHWPPFRWLATICIVASA
ncbi:MAG: methyltransferase domain-containing protein [Leptothrix sp. (in: b-proteobacteria)]